jgi:hypothetical protein
MIVATNDWVQGGDIVIERRWCAGGLEGNGQERNRQEAVNHIPSQSVVKHV